MAKRIIYFVVVRNMSKTFGGGAIFFCGKNTSQTMQNSGPSNHFWG